MRFSKEQQLNDPLFHLLKSLTGSEKRYIKLESQKLRFETTRNMKLFDALLRLKKYDEATLLKDLGWEKERHQLADRKAYLFEFVMKCMRQHYVAKSDQHKLGDLLKDIHFLMSCGQDRLTLLKFRQAEKLAKKTGNKAYQLILLEIQFRLMYKSFFKQKLKRENSMTAATEAVFYQTPKPDKPEATNIKKQTSNKS